MRIRTDRGTIHIPQGDYTTFKDGVVRVYSYNPMRSRNRLLVEIPYESGACHVIDEKADLGDLLDCVVKRLQKASTSNSFSWVIGSKIARLKKLLKHFHSVRNQFKSD